MTKERLVLIERLVDTAIMRSICNDMGIDEDPNSLFNVMKELVVEVKSLTEILSDAPHYSDCAYITSIRDGLRNPPRKPVEPCDCWKSDLVIPKF